MKNLMILLLMLGSLNMSAQCWDVTVDEFTGDKTSSKSFILSKDDKTGVILTVYDFDILEKYIYLTGAGPDCDVRCTDEDSYVDIVFDDGTRQRIPNTGEFDCDGQIRGHINKIRDRLSLTTIDKIRITGHDHDTYTLDVPQGDANKVQEFFQCLKDNL